MSELENSKVFFEKPWSSFPKNDEKLDENFIKFWDLQITNQLNISKTFPKYWDLKILRKPQEFYDDTNERF